MFILNTTWSWSETEQKQSKGEQNVIFYIKPVFLF